jgi:thioredoxin 1
MEPVVEKLAAKYSARVLFGKVNVDEEMNISSRYEVFSIPTFMIFKNGQPADAVIGAVGEASLERLVTSAIEK